MPTSWIADLESVPREGASKSAEVLLCEYPVALGIRQEERTLDLMREFQLIALGRRDSPRSSGTPEQLLAFADGMYREFGPALEAPREALEAAYAAGQATTELRYPLSSESATMIVKYAQLMEDADEFCRAGLLMNLEPDREVYALRRWTVEEFLRQFHGLAPRPWPVVAPAQRA